MVESNDQVFLSMEPIAKGKRTKRQRTPSLLTLSMANSSSTTLLDDHTTSGDYAPATTPPSPPSSDHRSSCQEEEEDMANCLMLLAQGHTTTKQTSSSSDAPRGKLLVESYQCKTCNRSFPSFQALGGHRASHRKPKAANIINNENDKKATVNSSGELEGGRVDQIVNPNTTLSLQMPTRVLHGGGKSKLHECAICGAEFTSGQALGGHMRRHRTVISAPPITTVSTTSINFERHEYTKKPKNGLHLDLNLPAPEDRESSLSVPPKQQVIVFSASPLIDCYY